MQMTKINYGEIPEFLLPFLKTEELLRLDDIGMNCGVEYTSFPLFKSLKKYSRLEHSLGCALIVYKFTLDKKQSLAALFHDIATPCFAHSIDFMNGDYLKQESTEGRTEEIITNSKEIRALLEKMNISIDEVTDYHRYPIADNDAPHLSSDRLEYTIGNALNYGFATDNELLKIYEDLEVMKNEEGIDELGFKTYKTAQRFKKLSLKCSKVYVSDEDRYAMELLAELMKEAVKERIITSEDLYTKESLVISKIENSVLKNKWDKYKALHMTVKEEDENARIIRAKKRYIDPLVKDKGRLSKISTEYSNELNEFLNSSFDYYVSGR